MSDFAKTPKYLIHRNEQWFLEIESYRSLRGSVFRPELFTVTGCEAILFQLANVLQNSMLARSAELLMKVPQESKSSRCYEVQGDQWILLTMANAEQDAPEESQFSAPGSKEINKTIKTIKQTISILEKRLSTIEQTLAAMEGSQELIHRLEALERQVNDIVTRGIPEKEDVIRPPQPVVIPDLGETYGEMQGESRDEDVEQDSDDSEMDGDAPEQDDDSTEQEDDDAEEALDQEAAEQRRKILGAIEGLWKELFKIALTPEAELSIEAFGNQPLVLGCAETMGSWSGKALLVGSLDLVKIAVPLAKVDPDDAIGAMTKLIEIVGKKLLEVVPGPSFAKPPIAGEADLFSLQQFSADADTVQIYRCGEQLLAVMIVGEV